MYRRNIDTTIQMARRQAAFGDAQAETRLLAALIRSYIINPHYASLAAYLGHPVARTVIDPWQKHPENETDAAALRRVIREGDIEKNLLFDFAINCVKRVIPLYEEFATDLPAVTAWTTTYELSSLPRNILTTVSNYFVCKEQAQKENRILTAKGVEFDYLDLWEPCYRITNSIQTKYELLLRYVVYDTGQTLSNANIFGNQRRAVQEVAEAAFNIGAAMMGPSIRGPGIECNDLISAAVNSAALATHYRPGPQHGEPAVEVAWQIRHLVNDYLLREK